MPKRDRLGDLEGVIYSWAVTLVSSAFKAVPAVWYPARTPIAMADTIIAYSVMVWPFAQAKRAQRLAIGPSLSRT
jgi:hypothetical protein